MTDDSELLRLFTQEGSQVAFTTVVQRYVPLVYSAALRQVRGDYHQAQEVTQSVFTLLARKASKLQKHPALVGWLYTTTYHSAAKLSRADHRRLEREKNGYIMEKNTHAPEDVVDWSELSPLLDELMLQLREDDRSAVLWRFFENRSHREIGERLGVTENAARMRVDRAIEALRAACTRRGIVSSATALGAVISGQAVTAAPVGLATATSAFAISTAGRVGLMFFMNSTAFKTVALLTVLGSGAAGLIWQHRENVRLMSENQELRTQMASASTKTSRIAAVGTVASTSGSSLPAQIDSLRNSPANSWQERAAQLREVVASLPELNIPEMQLATDEDWLDATKKPLETVDDYRRALASLRNVVIGRFAVELRKAIVLFAEGKTGNSFPTSPAQLEPYLDHHLGPAVWQRYVIQGANTMPNMIMGGDSIITLKSAVDSEFDAQFVIGPYGFGSTPYANVATQNVLAPVERAYEAANGGKRPTDLNQLIAYATTPEQRAALEKRRRDALAK